MKATYFKSKIAYKKFQVWNFERVLRAPFASGGYWTGKVNSLTTKNAPGFVSRRVSGKLELCENGYHAFSISASGCWENTSEKVYKVELLNGMVPYRGCTKILGTQFRIIEETSWTELKRLRTKLYAKYKHDAELKRENRKNQG